MSVRVRALTKTILHISIILLSTFLLVDLSYRLNTYALGTLDNLCNAFLPSGCLGADGGCRDAATLDDDRFCRLSRRNVTLESVQRIISNYYDLPDSSLAQYMLLNTTDEDTMYTPNSTAVNGLAPITFTSWSYDPMGTSLPKVVDVVTVNQSYAGPLDPLYHNSSAIRSFYARLASFSLDFKLNDVIPLSSHSSSEEMSCYEWTVSIKFDDENEASLKVYVDVMISGRCYGDTEAEQLSSLNFVLHTTLIVLCTACSILLTCSTVAQFQSLLRARSLMLSKDSANFVNRLPSRLSSKITFNEERGEFSLPHIFWFRFMDIWGILINISCFFNIVACVSRLQGYALIEYNSYLMISGFGCALSWITAVSYMQSSRRLYAIVLIVQGAAPQVFRVVVGGAGGMMAYALVGVAVFGPNVERFSSTPKALITLFCCMNGDIVLETLDLLKLNHVYLGPLYLISFMFLFTYFMLNVMLTVVEESLWKLKAEADANTKEDGDIGAGGNSSLFRSFAGGGGSSRFSRTSRSSLRGLGGGSLLRANDSLRESRGSFGRSVDRSTFALTFFGGGGAKKKVTDLYNSDEIFFSLLTVCDAYIKSKHVGSGGGGGGEGGGGGGSGGGGEGRGGGGGDGEEAEVGVWSGGGLCSFRNRVLCFCWSSTCVAIVGVLVGGYFCLLTRSEYATAG